MSCTAQNLICPVCGNPAVGRHYSVTVCSACKAFFRRYEGKILPPGQECQGSCESILDPQTKKYIYGCPLCRLKRCLAVGMTRKGADKGSKRCSKSDTKKSKKEPVKETGSPPLPAGSSAISSIPFGHPQGRQDNVMCVENTGVSTPQGQQAQAQEVNSSPTDPLVEYIKASQGVKNKQTKGRPGENVLPFEFFMEPGLAAELHAAPSSGPIHQTITPDPQEVALVTTQHHCQAGNTTAGNQSSGIFGSVESGKSGFADLAEFSCLPTSGWNPDDVPATNFGLWRSNGPIPKDPDPDPDDPVLNALSDLPPELIEASSDAIEEVEKLLNSDDNQAAAAASAAEVAASCQSCQEAATTNTTTATTNNTTTNNTVNEATAAGAQSELYQIPEIATLSPEDMNEVIENLLVYHRHYHEMSEETHQLKEEADRQYLVSIPVQ